ncbi:MAG: hypothetical protein K5739_00745 [Lachnospiraceae bacterium]|nr:hypothetical protein [Lachnospiraceae bacterium]
MNKTVLLLRTLLLSTSSVNLLKHSKDKKKKRRVILAYVGLFCLYGMLVGYSFAICLGYSVYGLTDSIPALCAVTISALAMIFTFFKVNGYLLNFKEYDMIMSLPFQPSTVAGCKFLYMYIKSLPWYLSISISMLAGYGVFAKPPVGTCIIWLILSLFIPVIPSLFASLLGFIIAKLSVGFKHKKAMQTILSLIFVLFCFSLRYIIEAFFRNGKIRETLESMSGSIKQAGKIYPPIQWFSETIVDGKISGGLLLAGVSILLFSLVFFYVGRSYRKINSALQSHRAKSDYRMTRQKSRSVIHAIVFKEFKRMTGSVVYMTNGAIGVIMAVLLGVITLIIGFNKVIAIVTNGAPVDGKMLQPAIPFVVYFLVGMMSTPAFTPSLEGKNYWIVRSLPIKKETLYRGKMLFNLYLTVPVMIFSVLCLCISAKVPRTETILDVILGIMLCCFSTAWGCACGVKHMRLDWENEVEVIKQGAAVALYMLPNMLVVMALVVLVVFLGLRMDRRVLSLIFIGITALLSLLSYLRVMALAKKE